MTDNNQPNHHWKTLDRDLGRIAALEAATSYVAKPMVGLGISLVFVVVAALVATVLFGEENTRWIVVLAAAVGA
ncbi:MAG: inorganic phosphate transporter, partial [Rhodobacteraceae bacterium]|nr:inorganic phosphate transporter [Paracoccaceae bacterium]